MQSNVSPRAIWRTIAERRPLIMSIAVLGWSIRYVVSLSLSHTTGAEMYGVLTAALATGAAVANLILLRAPRVPVLVTAAVLILWALVAVAGVAGTIAHIVGPVPGPFRRRWSSACSASSAASRWSSDDAPRAGVPRTTKRSNPMSKTTVTQVFVGAIVAVVVGAALGVATAVAALTGGVVAIGGPNVVTVDGPAFAGTIGWLVVASLVVAGGAVAALASWIGALVITARLDDKTWFVVLLVLGLLSLGWVAMVAYVIAGPDDTMNRVGDHGVATVGEA
jgi:hypothetical protein